jgi:hypothetical protein
MTSLPTGFFGYAPGFPELADSVELAIEQINSLHIVELRGRRSLGAAGPASLAAVTKAIDASDLFACELSHLDTEVLFELGYAIATNKRVWIALNNTLPQAQREYQRLSPLSGLTYSTYQNSHNLVSQFLTDQPYADARPTPYAEALGSAIETQSAPNTLLYLLSEVPTDASLRLTRTLQDSGIPLAIDDPQEVSSHPLVWYVQYAWAAYGVVVHLIDSVRESSGVLVQNPKCSLVAGLAHGFGKPTLLLAHDPFSTTLDFQDLLRIHKTSQGCVRSVEIWLPTVRHYHAEHQRRFEKERERLGTAAGLQRIKLGEYIAENESEALSGYFVETAAYRDALAASQYKIFVGRKGSGKTANLYRLMEEISRDKRNHVCVIKPIDYDVEGLVALLSPTLARAQSGYLLASLWKYLITTELALSVCARLESLGPNYTQDEDEAALVGYVEAHEDFRGDFTERLEYAVGELCGIDFSQSSTSSTRVRVSEVLHEQRLAQLHTYVGAVLQHRSKVYVLVDNLDKAWRSREDLGVLAEFLFALLSVGDIISGQYQKGGLRRPRVNLILVVFLRSDIFSHVMATAREADKVACARMDWDDPALLQRVIEERFYASLEEPPAAHDIWDRFFVPSVRGVAARDHIVGRIIPRPRDIIYYCTRALSHAINHKHARIEESDLLQAEEDYSGYAFTSLLAETETRFPGMENVIYEFVGQPDVVTRDQIAQFLRKAQVADGSTDLVIQLLCEATFLGLETAPGTFEFLYEANRERVLKKLAQGVAEASKRQRFRINAAFHAYLGINPVEGFQQIPVGGQHPNITVLLERMETALGREDYAGVLHASATILETLAKDVVGTTAVQDQTLGSFFERYRRDSLLPAPILDYVKDIYDARSITPLAAHGSIASPSITKEKATSLAAITRAIVEIEYRLRTAPVSATPEVDGTVTEPH